MKNTAQTQSIHDIAAQFNLYTYENFTPEFKDYWDTKMNPYTQGKDKVIPNDLKQVNTIEVGLFFECQKSNDETPYIERNYIIVKSKDSDLLCMLQIDRSKKYYLHPYYGYLNKLQRGLSSYKYSEAIGRLTEPNKIGVFTEKKIGAWVDYCNSYINSIKLLAQTTENTNKDNQWIIDSFIKDMGEGNGIEVQKYENRTTIYTPLFVVTFQLDLGSGHLDKKIQFRGDINHVVNITKKLR